MQHQTESVLSSTEADFVWVLADWQPWIDDVCVFEEENTIIILASDDGQQRDACANAERSSETLIGLALKIRASERRCALDDSNAILPYVMQQNVRPQRDKKKTINSGALWHNIEMALATDNSVNKNKSGKKKKIRVSARLGTTNHSPAKIMHLREMFTQNEFPDANNKALIAASLRMTAQQVSTWFRNSRKRGSGSGDNIDLIFADITCCAVLCFHQTL